MALKKRLPGRKKRDRHRLKNLKARGGGVIPVCAEAAANRVVLVL